MKKTLLLLLTLFLIMNSEAQVIENGVYVVRSALNRNHVMALSGAVARNYNQLWILEKVGKSHNGYNDCPLCNGTGYVGNQLCALCLKRATGR